jgi:RNA polymerase sigma factor (sigma-70 family)
MRRATMRQAPSQTIPLSSDVAADGGSAADQELSAWMARAQTGDKSAYEMLLRECIPFIRSVARQHRVHPDWIDDVVQDTLISVHDARATYDPSRSFLAWLRTIAQRRAFDGIRRQGRTRTREIYAPDVYENHEDLSASPERQTYERDRNALLNEAILALPASQRDAVEAFVLDADPYADGSTARDRTAGALRVSLHRALKSLRVKFRGKEGDNGSE